MALRSADPGAGCPRTAYENEILAAKFIILSLRRLVTLEKLHDDVVDFNNNDSLQPLPAECYRVKGVDLDDLAFANEIVDEDAETPALPADIPTPHNDADGWDETAQ